MVLSSSTVIITSSLIFLIFILAEFHFRSCNEETEADGNNSQAKVKANFATWVFWCVCLIVWTCLLVLNFVLADPWTCYIFKTQYFKFLWWLQNSRALYFIFKDQSESANKVLKITVKASNEETIHLYLLCNKKVCAIKYFIQLQENISSDRQKLRYGGTWLQNDKRFCDYNIKDKSTLQLYEEINISVKFSLGKTIPLTVHKGVQVHDVKAKIHRIHKIPEEMQTLVALEPDGTFQRVLENHHLLMNYGNINSGCEFELRIQRVQIYVKTLTDQTIPIQVGMDIKIRNVRTLLSEVRNYTGGRKQLVLNGNVLNDDDHLVTHNIKHQTSMLLDEEIDVFVDIDITNTYNCFKVRASDSIYCIRAHICSMLSIPSERQVLTFNGNPLQNDLTLYQSGIKQESSLHLIEKLALFVRYGDGKQIQFEVRSNDDFQCIKHNIHKSLNIPPERQLLHFNGNLLCQTLCRSGILHQSCVDLTEVIEISVQCQKNLRTQMRIKLKASVTIQCIKTHIYSRLGIPSERQVLIFNGNSLQEDLKLYQSGITHKSSLHLIEKLDLIVRYNDGKQIQFEVRSNDDLQCIKANIHKSLNIPPERQRLHFNGNLLQQNQTLYQSGINHQSCVDLTEVIEISVQYERSKQIQFEVRSSDDIQCIKTNIHKSLNIPPERQLLHFNGNLLLQNQTLRQSGINHLSCVALVQVLEVFLQYEEKSGMRKIEFRISSTDSIAKVMDQFQKESSVPTRRQRLVFDGQQLKNGHMISEYHIKNKSTIYLTEDMIISVKTHGKQIKLEVRSNDDLQCIKTNIHKSLNIPPERQRLHFNGNLLQQNQTLYQSGIYHQSCVELTEVIEIIVEYEKSKQIQFEVRSSDDLQCIKTNIYKSLNIPPERQLLHFNGNLLLQKQTLRQSGINHMSCVALVEVLEVFLQYEEKWGMRKIEFRISSTDSVVKVMDQIQKESSVPTTRQRLVLDGQQLKDGHMISEYHIKNKSTIDLTEDLIISVKSHGKQIQLEVRSNDDIQCIKTNIHKSLNIPPERQRLQFNGNLLQQKQTLYQSGIYHQSCVELTEVIEIIVEYERNKQIQFEVRLSDDLQCIKTNIQKSLNIPPERQILHFNGNLLQKKQPLRQIGIKHLSCVALSEVLEILVKYKGKSRMRKYEFRISSTDTIAKLMNNIQTKTSIPSRRQRLVFNGQQLKYGHMISEYHIKNKSPIRLTEDLTISIITHDKTLTLNVNSSETVEEVKKTVHKMNRMPVHLQCLTYENKTLDDFRILYNVGISHLSIWHLTEKQCDYYTTCLEVRSLLNLPDAYFDFENKHNKCYCSRCHGARNESHYYHAGIPERNYTKPIGWGRILLHLPVRAKALKIFDEWNVAYHGTTVSAAKAILESGMLMLPGDSTLRGDSIQECPGHYNKYHKPAGFTTEQIFVSPSIKYACCNVYAKGYSMHLPSCGEGRREVKLVFQVRIHPRRRSVGPETIGRRDQIDPPISNSEIEWSTVARDAVIPIALLIHVE